MPKEPKTRNSKVTNAKRKGREFTQKIRQMFIDAFDLSEEDCRIAVGYEQGTDLKFLEEAQKRVGLYIECKNQKTISLGPWLKQTLHNTPKGETPALLYHKPVQGDTDIWITVPASHYLEIRRRLDRIERAI